MGLQAPLGVHSVVTSVVDDVTICISGQVAHTGAARTMYGCTCVLFDIKERPDVCSNCNRTN